MGTKFNPVDLEKYLKKREVPISLKEIDMIEKKGGEDLLVGLYSGIKDELTEEEKEKFKNKSSYINEYY